MVKTDNYHMEDRTDIYMMHVDIHVTYVKQALWCVMYKDKLDSVVMWCSVWYG